MIWYRLKGSKGEWFFGYIVQRRGDMIQIGPYNGAVNGRWYSIHDIEQKPYK